MEKKIKNILLQHNCTFIKMLSECRVLWKNQNGIIRNDDIFVLSNMSKKAWDFYSIY